MPNPYRRTHTNVGMSFYFNKNFHIISYICNIQVCKSDVIIRETCKEAKQQNYGKLTFNRDLKLFSKVSLYSSCRIYIYKSRLYRIDENDDENLNIWSCHHEALMKREKRQTKVFT